MTLRGLWMRIYTQNMRSWRAIITLRIRYFIRRRRIKRAFGHRKIRVLFPISCCAKWKCQSLYDEMSGSDNFEPVVVLTPMDVERLGDLETRRERMRVNADFFEKRACKFVYGYKPESDSYIPFSELNADIVCYTQPWAIEPIQDVYETSKRALTCYVPYFVQNYGCMDMECMLDFHRRLWRHFTLSNSWAMVFENCQGSRRAGKVVGLGHPMLDNFRHRQNIASEGYVIYAPHWSCNTAECFSTFLQNGNKILAVAKAHPEIKWVFKPHPTLAKTLIENCGWTKTSVEEYYREWERISIPCYDGNYVDVFLKSSAMITDCASFLMEYACTGNPIINLVSPNAKYQPHPIAAKLFGSYYQAHNWEEFEKHFKIVVLDRNDYKKEERLSSVREMRLLDNFAAKNILDYLNQEFSA